MSDARVEVAICNRGRKGLIPVEEFEFGEGQRINLIAILEKRERGQKKEGGRVSLSVGKGFGGETYLSVHPWDGAIRVRRGDPGRGPRVELGGSTFCGELPVMIDLYPGEPVIRVIKNEVTNIFEQSEGGVYGPAEPGQVLRARLITRE